MAQSSGNVPSQAAPSLSREVSVRDWAALGVLALAWGGSFVFVEIALDAVPPPTLVALRIGLAAIALWPVVLLMRAPTPPLQWQFWGGVTLLALLTTAAPFNLIVWGQNWPPSAVDPGLAAILNSSTTFWGVVAAHLFTSDEKANSRSVAGVFLGVCGAAVAIGPEKLLALDPSAAGQLAIVGATICYALGLVWGKRFHAVSRLTLTTSALTVAAILSVGFALIMDGVDGFARMGSASADVWISILLLAVISTSAALRVSSISG